MKSIETDKRFRYARRIFLKQTAMGLSAVFLSGLNSDQSIFRQMDSSKAFDVIIIGGSYSGLSAAMALGRALKSVLIIDDGKPCNKQTPYSHNFLTNDGKTPAEIRALSQQQVSKYDAVQFMYGWAKRSIKMEDGFEIELGSGEKFHGKKLLFATGIKDLLPDIEGIDACWGISVIHCPYCHGYEVKNEKTGILGNGNSGFEFARLISNWTNDLTLFTNGASMLSEEQMIKLRQHKIKVVEKEIHRFKHSAGSILHIVFKNGDIEPVKAFYAPSPFEQHCKIPETLGCELTEEGYLKIDNFQETTIKGVYATGDNASKMRTVANAVSMGTAVGISISKKLIQEAF
jgi:thioredoxin reductase